MAMRVNYWTEGDNDFFSIWVDGEHDSNGDVPADVVDTAAWLAEQYPGAEIVEAEATA